jgi:hypothetical protein
VIVLLVPVAALSTWLVPAVTWSSDRWEREPVALAENVLLLGVALQPACVFAARWWFGFEDWQLPGPLSVTVPVGLLIPFVAGATAEMDEPHAGLVYAAAFASGPAWSCFSGTCLCAPAQPPPRPCGPTCCRDWVTAPPVGGEPRPARTASENGRDGHPTAARRRLVLPVLLPGRFYRHRPAGPD